MSKRWTVKTLKKHFDALMKAERRHNKIVEKWKWRFHKERDRRLSEAHSRDRIVQDYKNAASNELREQIGSERNLYETVKAANSREEKLIEMLQPLADFVREQRGGSARISNLTGNVVQTITSVGTLLGIAFLIFGAA